MILGNRAALTAMLALLAGVTPAHAGDWPDHDRRIEHWTARKLAERLGELRGAFGPDEHVGRVTVHKAIMEPQETPRHLSPVFAPAPVADSLPPIVLNDGVPAGVDPIITGSNARPTLAARRAGHIPLSGHFARTAAPPSLPR